jgi:hypothetical protein
MTYRRWGAVTAVSEVKPALGDLQLRAVFLFGNITTIAARPLIKMKVIALGRWTLWPNKRNARYLLFETNWSGADQTYIPDFARIMRVQWRSIWGATKDFPGPLPTTRLLEFVDRVDFGVDHFWTDYHEGATTQVITSALELQPKIERFVNATSDLTPSEFQSRWRNLLVEIQDLI